MLCTNVLWNILQHKWILEQVPTKVSNRIFVREKREKYREKNQQNDFFLLTCIYINININICIKYIKCYVTFSYETGLQVKFKIKQPRETVHIQSKETAWTVLSEFYWYGIKNEICKVIAQSKWTWLFRITFFSSRDTT